MREFEANIGRDGTVYHLAWIGHGPTARYFELPENTSPWRQNYYEFDLRAPFADNLGLQARGIEEPPEAVVRSAQRLAAKLRAWHLGRDLRSIPHDWGDVVEHVYEVRGARTPKYLSGRGGVHFTGLTAEVREGIIHRLLGSARVELLGGTARVGQMWGQSRIDEMRDDSRVESTWQSARIGRMTDRSQVDMTCQSSWIGEMWGDARVLVMHGATRAMALHERALCGRGVDGTVYTPDRRAKKRALVAGVEQWERVQVVDEGASVFA